MSISLHIARRSIYGLLSIGIFLPLFFPSPAFSQGEFQSFSFPPATRDAFSIAETVQDTTLQLAHQFIASGTDSVVFDSLRTLCRGEEYFIDYRFGKVRLSRQFLEMLHGGNTAIPHRITVYYTFFPFQFQDFYSRRNLVVLKDSTTRDSIRIARPRGTFSVEDIFGPNIQKSGSIVRGFTVGSNRDLSLTSGLRMQLSGRIGSDIDVAASLTDENTPIQPEGTTLTLQEFDKVFVEIKSRDVGATLGDFNLDLTGTEFSRLSRKLQGAEGTASYRLGPAGGSTLISGAITRGKYNTLQFTGSEGVQGPYVLTGKNGERGIIVIAGTEKVYVNGEPQVRGETNDYVIDYSTGEITFTTRRLITAASRIVVDYQFTDRQYSRSLFGFQNTTGVFDNRAALTFTFIREADDPDSPIDFTIADSTRAILRNAGNDRNKAVISGVTRVDSNGLYVRVDTILAGTPTQFYRYAPGDPNAKYRITFSFVGPGQGEYISEQVGVFVWKGPGGGDYLPVQYLPFPQSSQIFDLALDVSPLRDFKLTGEFGRSTFTANRFSPLSGEAGSAFKAGAIFTPKDVHIGGANIGDFDLRLNERFVDHRFVPIDRTNDIEFTRKWGVDSLAASNEEIREATLKYFPKDSIMVGAGYGSFKRGELQQSTRTDATVALKRADLPTLQYYLENVESKDALGDNSSSWLRQNGELSYSIWKAVPFVRYEGERREITSTVTDTLKPGSLRFDQVDAGVAFNAVGPLTLTGQMGWRTDDLFQSRMIARESRSVTQTYGARLAQWNDLTSSLDVTLRKKSFSPLFQELGNADIRSVLVRDQTRFAPLNRGLETDLYYEVSTERASKLERVYVRVATGTGNYKYLGDLNGNGVADENEFVLTRFDGDYVAITLPTTQLYPIIDLKTSVRLKMTPERFLPRQDGTLARILSILSTETYVRVEEKSTERDLKQIYLLHFRHFRQDSTTITGSTLFTQDLNLFEGKPGFSMRFRFQERSGLNNFSGGIERTYGRERSIRLRWQLVPEISNQIDFANKIDRATSALASSRLRDILSNDIIFDLAYRPEQKIEAGLKLEVSRSADRFHAPALTADLNVQTLRFIYAFLGSGQARVEASREEILFGGPPENFPYELTGGRIIGKTWLWHLAFDYRVTNFIQATFAYDGRVEGGGPIVHTGRAEVRAFF